MRRCAVTSSLAIAALLFARSLAGHCDTMRGPVVADARTALNAGDVTPVLKWVRAQDEPELRAAFAKTVRVRAAGTEARDLADRWFFETAVRLHRASEAEPFTGLKTTAVPEPLALADASIESGDADELIEHLSREAANSLRAHFAQVRAARAHMNDNVEAGRRYVATYVSFMRLIEQLTGGDHGESEHQTNPGSH